MLFPSSNIYYSRVDALTATNGARIEWLNPFTYFANRSVYAFDSNDGIKGNGKTRVRIVELLAQRLLLVDKMLFSAHRQ